MLRANLLELGHSTTRPLNLGGELEALLEKIGGTNFSNVITSAPDTPRGLGIFFSGKSPRSSGIDRRSRYPGPFLSDSDSLTFVTELSDEIPIRVVTKNLPAAGLALPRAIQERSTLFSDVTQIPPSPERTPDSLSEVIIILDNSYHQAVGFRFGHHSAHKQGSRAISRNLAKAIAHLKLTVGDTLFLFSDHGCKLSKDKTKEPKDFLDRDRSQIVFFHSQFLGEGIVENPGLYGMEDAHFMVREAIARLKSGGDSASKQVIPIAVPPVREMVHVEDHSGFSTSIGHPVNQWAVFGSDFDYFEPRLGEVQIFLHKGSETTPEMAAKLSQMYLKKHASNYSLFKEEFESLYSGYSRIPIEQQEQWQRDRVASAPPPSPITRGLWWALGLPTAIWRKLSAGTRTRKIRPTPESNTGTAQSVEL